MCLAACGSRSNLTVGEQSLEPCETDLHCDRGNLCEERVCDSGFCATLSTVSCDDGNECTEDKCVPETGICQNQLLVSDADQDGVFGPRAGFAAGAPGACGEDCDDTNASVYPGAREVCDGTDNDCNGTIDDEMTFEPTQEPALRLSAEQDEAAVVGGFAYNGAGYGLSYSAKRGAWQNQFLSIDDRGSSLSRVPITSVNTDTFAGALQWTGSVYAAAWEDTRFDNNYEIYVALLDSQGGKLGPDVRISEAEDFSLHPQLAWTGEHFIVVWDDRRPEAGAGESGIALYGQLLNADAEPRGPNVRLTPVAGGAESPQIALGPSRLGIAFTSLRNGRIALRFSTVGRDLSDVREPVDLEFMDARDPSIAWVSDRFILSWEHYDTAPGEAIWAAAVSESGEVLVPPQRVTEPAAFARSQNILPLGDRFILAWADTSFGRYEILTRMFSPDLTPLGATQRVTNEVADSVNPRMAFGAQGDIGIVFKDWRSGSQQVYFRRLSCLAR